MRTLLLSVISLFILNACIADPKAPEGANNKSSNSNWELLLRTPLGDEFFILPDSIDKGNGDLVLDVLINNSTPDPFNQSFSSILTLKIFCEGNQMQDLRTVFYAEPMGKGRVIDDSMVPLPAIPIPPSSVWEMVYGSLCGRSSDTDTKTRRGGPYINDRMRIAPLSVEWLAAHKTDQQQLNIYLAYLYDVYPSARLDSQYTMDYSEPNKPKLVGISRDGNIESRLLVDRVLYPGSVLRLDYEKMYLDAIEGSDRILSWYRFVIENSDVQSEADFRKRMNLITDLIVTGRNEQYIFFITRDGEKLRLPLEILTAPQYITLLPHADLQLQESLDLFNPTNPKGSTLDNILQVFGLAIQFSASIPQNDALAGYLSVLDALEQDEVAKAVFYGLCDSAIKTGNWPLCGELLLTSIEVGGQETLVRLNALGHYILDAQEQR
jgi:hypothetical protein